MVDGVKRRRMKQVLAVYEGDQGYVRGLTGYLTVRHRVPFQVVTLTKEEMVVHMAASGKIDVLLIGADVYNEQIGALPIRKVLLLTEELCASEMVYLGREVRTVYKYQSMEKIVDVLRACYEALRPPLIQPEDVAQADCIAVYSPVKRCGKTMFALLYGQQSAQEVRTLYLSLEYGKGVEQLCGLEGGADLADVLDQFEQGTLSDHLPELVRRWEGLDVILPVRDPEDVREISWESLQGLLGWLRTCGVYDRILLDAAEALYQPVKLLETCSRVFLPVREEWVAKEKTEFFLEGLRQSGKTELLGRIQEISLPEFTWNGTMPGLIQLQCTPFGDYVRHVLSGEPA